MPEVKSKRSYDASGRRRRAQHTREEVLDVARQQFLDRGYAATTVADVAREAGVSAETVYKAFGGKPGVVRALWQRGLSGPGSEPAEQRSDALSESESDPRKILSGWGRLVAEVTPDLAPILLLIRAAAATDPDMATLLADTEQQRRIRMQHNAERLRRHVELRSGLTLTAATDILWTYTAPELYELMVVKSGWSPERFGNFVGEQLAAALLSDRASAGS